MVSVPFHEMDVLLRVVNDVARQGHAEGLDNGDVPVQERPFSRRYDGIPRTDPRMRNSRETALSVKMLLERVCNGNGAGKLLVDFYVEEMSWWTFSKNERWIIEKTARAFAKVLREAGFLPEKG